MDNVKAKLCDYLDLDGFLLLIGLWYKIHSFYRDFLEAIFSFLRKLLTLRQTVRVLCRCPTTSPSLSTLDSRPSKSNAIFSHNPFRKLLMPVPADISARGLCARTSMSAFPLIVVVYRRNNSRIPNAIFFIPSESRGSAPACTSTSTYFVYKFEVEYHHHIPSEIPTELCTYILSLRLPTPPNASPEYVHTISLWMGE